MTKSVKYLAGMMLLAAMVTLLACTGEQTVAPAPITEPTAPPTAMAEQPTEAVATPTEAMAVQAGNRLQTVKDRGNVVCANNTQLAGFGFIDAGGNTMGFDVDLCRAVAAAVLGDADAVDFRPTTAAERGPHHAVRSGGHDVPQHHLDIFPRRYLGQLRPDHVL